ncbi:MAG TPA: DNRLRE domain-containing protein [Aquihabitans sp.]|jgi:hypothetical protein|nr:DNRLRE domain-containing protein [Aquihabitans sp.]
MPAHTPSRRPLVALVLALGATIVAAACEPVPPDSSTTTTAPTTTAPPSTSGDVGWEGPSFEGASGSPSGSKPESKLWFNDGFWWADLWDVATGDFYIHRLDVASKQWIRTGTRLDERSNSRSDALWDGTHLYVASHAFGEGSSSTPTGQPAQLRRFSYQADSDSYVPDAGFPVMINDARTESLVIEKDSVGRIWATWMQDAKIMVATSTPGGTSFGAATQLPGTASEVSSDDLSSVVSFGGNRIGVLWSNQDDDTMYFAARTDSDPVDTWGPVEVAYRGTNAADDHINLKNVADQGGRVLAAVKTSTSGTAPLVHLLARNPATGAWTSHVFGTGSDNHTRPIVVVDRGGQAAHMFATSGQSGGSIYRKVAPLSSLSFAPGKGTPVLTDAAEPDINNATSTKQAVDASTGLVVLATNDTTRRYWTHYDPLGGSPPPTTTTTTTTAAPTTTTTTVAPTTTTPTTTTAAPPTGEPRTVVAAADAMVKSSSPTRNYGADPDLRTRAGDPAYSSYLRFDVTGLAAPPRSAKLRLFVTDASKEPGSVRATSTAWSESTLTWQNAPAPAGDALATAPASTAGTWLELDVTRAVTGNGPVALVLTTTSTDSGISASRETSTAPQLVLTP